MSRFNKIVKGGDREGLLHEFESLGGCCMPHAQVLKPEQIGESICYALDNVEMETASVQLFYLTDGRVGVLEESSDSSGHG